MKHALSLFTSLLFIAAGQAQDTAPFPPPPENISSIANIADEREPGDRLVVTGTVFHKDKKTPYRDRVLYFYQTDITGRYNRTDGSYRAPRLFGWLRTDRNGRYEIRTIKPGSYPRGTTPAHIHVTVQLGDSRTKWLDSFLFEDDPHLNGEERSQPKILGTFSPVLRTTKDKDGVLHAVRDIVIPD